MALSGFAPSAYTSMTATNGTAGAIAIPGSSPTTALITNLGAASAIVLLAATQSAAELVSSSNGTAIVPGQSLALTVGSNTWIGAIGMGFGNAQLNISVGV